MFHNDNHQKHVFCVDDDPEMLSLIVALLEEKGIFKVHQFKTAMSAIDAMAEVKPSLMILDFMMPEMDGIAAYNKIKGMEGMADVKVVLVTGSKSHVSLKQCNDLGIPILAKPFGMTEFQKFIRSVL